MRLFTSHPQLDTDDWYTPEWVFDALGIQFDVDVAAPQGGVPWVPADTYYDSDTDGLQQQWEGLVWCNPPYSAPTQWAYRMAEHANGCILVRADLSTNAQYRLWETADALWVPQKRLQFVNGHGDTSGSVNFSTVMFGYGCQALLGMMKLAEANGTTRFLNAR